MTERLKISVVTVVFNAVDTIAQTIESVQTQNYPYLEHIVVDGGSTDGTSGIIDSYQADNMIVIRETDSGIYEAMNKGIAAATGEVIGFLNADDIYSRTDVIAKIASVFQDRHVNACFADVVFVRDNLDNVVRYYRSNKFKPDRVAYGWMPAHPTLYLEKSLFEKFGYLKTDYKIAADFELIARLFVVHKITYHYIPEVLVIMRAGGISTAGLKSKIILNWEIVRACRENSIPTNIFKILLKVPFKLLELFSRPS